MCSFFGGVNFDSMISIDWFVTEITGFECAKDSKTPIHFTHGKIIHGTCAPSNQVFWKIKWNERSSFLLNEPHWFPQRDTVHVDKHVGGSRCFRTHQREQWSFIMGRSYYSIGSLVHGDIRRYWICLFPWLLHFIIFVCKRLYSRCDIMARFGIGSGLLFLKKKEQIKRNIY